MRSMTGFGEAYIERGETYVSLQITSVNSRHLDVQFSLSGSPTLERKVVQEVRDRIERGKVKIQCESNVIGETEERFHLDREAVERYIDRVDRLGREYPQLDDEMDALELLTLPGVLSVREQPVQDARAESMLLNAVDEALHQMVGMREREGEEMTRDLAQRRERIGAIVEDIEQRVPAMLDRYQKKYRQRVEELLDLQGEELRERLENELQMYADKCDISEEVVRIKSHLKQFDQYLEQQGTVGRSLEFLLQEIQREINTVGAKANDATISQKAVDVKTELEKCREQVKNVE